MLTSISQSGRMQRFEWGGKFFYELCLIFGSASSAGIFDDGAKLFVDLCCRQARFPKSMICQHLDDICGAASAGSTDLHRLEEVFINTAEYIGVKLATKAGIEKAFAPRKDGVIFGIYYDTAEWTWSIPEEKLERILMQIEKACSAQQWPEKEVKSLVGKLIHVKALIPTSRFHANHIMQWLADSNTADTVEITQDCKRQLAFWRDTLLACNNYMLIPTVPDRPPPMALQVYCDAAGGSNQTMARGSGGVCGPLWYFHQWSPAINTGKARWQEKKIGRKLTALELLGPLIFLAAAPDAFRRASATCWIDNAGSVAVWAKGYSPHCSMSTTIVQATAAVAAALGCTLYIEKITRCSNTGAVLADALSKAQFTEFFNTADTAQWLLTQEPLKLPTALLAWLHDPIPDPELGSKICRQLAASTSLLMK